MSKKRTGYDLKVGDEVLKEVSVSSLSYGTCKFWIKHKIDSTTSSFVVVDGFRYRKSNLQFYNAGYSGYLDLDLSNDEQTKMNDHKAHYNYYRNLPHLDGVGWFNKSSSTEDLKEASDLFDKLVELYMKSQKGKEDKFWT